jgi:hypothetical protein
MSTNCKGNITKQRRGFLEKEIVIHFNMNVYFYGNQRFITIVTKPMF